MRRRTSPPKHMHDETSPLPLGMDWTPPPKKWNGRDTVWPHNPSSGWSYCVTIPSWIALPKSSASDPLVCYRVQVGMYSPEGIISIRGVLRRFNDFLKLFSDLKKAFPKKNIPSAPPKGLLQMRSRAFLEERRCSLEEWMTKLLSDIDISRTMAVASFLELEAAARSSFLEANQHRSAVNPPNSLLSSHEFHASSSSPVVAGSISMPSDYGSDTIHGTSEMGTPSFERDDSSDAGLEDLTLHEGLTNAVEKLVKYGMSNIDERLLMGETNLDQLEDHARHNKAQARQITDNGNTSRETSSAVGRMDSLFEVEPSKIDGHTRKPSDESIRSDVSSYRGSELSNSWSANMLSEATVELNFGPECSRTVGGIDSADLQHHNAARIILPMDQRSKLNRVLMIMQRRLVTAKTDIEDLITRLNQEMAVKDYLTTKVCDLEVELDITKQKSKENLQQALMIEKERVTKMQWDMEEMRRKSLEMELNLKAQEDLLQADPASASFFQEKDELRGELDAAKEQINTLLKQHEELEKKSKSDIKVLVKEVKSLRKSQNELQQQLSTLDKSATQQLLQQEKRRNEEALVVRRKLLHDCEILHSQLQECNINSDNVGNYAINLSSTDDALDFLMKSDDQIDIVLAEVQSFVQDDNTMPKGNDDDDDTVLDKSNDLRRVDDELRKMVGAIITDNGKLRKQVNFLVRSAVKTNTSASKEESDQSSSVGTVMTQFRHIK